ncbi:hypothetical protein BH09BAC1_BH09BAC1_01500 [soil metagenome]
MSGSRIKRINGRSYYPIPITNKDFKDNMQVALILPQCTNFNALLNGHVVPDS